MHTDEKTELYTRLNYTQYKHLEEQLSHWEQIETTHTSMEEGFYHKALRLELGSLIIEVQGPTVKEPLKDDTMVTSPPEEESKLDHCSCTFNQEGDSFNISVDPECPNHFGGQIPLTQGDTATIVSPCCDGSFCVCGDAQRP